MSDVTEGVETPTPSIEDSLAAGFDGATQVETSSTTDAMTAPGSPASGDQNAVLTALEPPKHWSEIDRSLFTKAERETQQRWLDRETEYARGIDSKSQEAAKFRKEHEAYQEILQPYQRELEMQGLSPTQFFKSLVGWQQYIQNNPREGLLRLAQAYGVDPQQLLEQTQNVDPTVAKLQKELSEVKTQFTGFMTSAQQREFEGNLSRVSMFADEKDASGNPAHPYFDEVSSDIMTIMKAQPGTTLEQAYNKALRLNDQVWDKVQATKQASTAKQADAERLAAVEKAKKAAVANTPGNAKGSTKKLSLEDDLRARFGGSD